MIEAGGRGVGVAMIGDGGPGGPDPPDGLEGANPNRVTGGPLNIP